MAHSLGWWAFQWVGKCIQWPRDPFLHSTRCWVCYRKLARTAAFLFVMGSTAVTAHTQSVPVLSSFLLPFPPAWAFFFFFLYFSWFISVTHEVQEVYVALLPCSNAYCLQTLLSGSGTVSWFPDHLTWLVIISNQRTEANSGLPSILPSTKGLTLRRTEHSTGLPLVLPGW